MLLELERIQQFVSLTRAYLEPCWERFHADQQGSAKHFVHGNRNWPVPEIKSAGTCRHTSAFAWKHLKLTGIRDLSACGGYMSAAPEMDQEQLKHISHVNDPVLGPLYSHFWIEHNGWVIDLTKDQFGWQTEDIWSVENAKFYYKKDPALSNARFFLSLKSTVEKFEGQTQTTWQDADLHFERTRKRFLSYKEELASVVSTPDVALGPVR